MQSQFEILNEICRIFYQYSNKFDELTYVYRFNPDEEWVGTRLSTFLNKEKVSSGLSSQNKEAIDDLCSKLHDEMLSHTGGDWRKFILVIDANNEVKTQFIYEIQSCLDDD